MSIVTMKRGDTAIPFTDSLLVAGAPVVGLAGATVKFLLEKGQSAYSWDATITDEVSAAVEFDPAGADPPFPLVLGDYSQEWEVTFANGKKLTFPTADHHTVKILKDLNNG